MFNKENKDELLKIEEEIKALKERKSTILNEIKKAEDDKKAERKKEVEDAYNNFMKLLKAYEEDFGGGYKVSLSGRFSC